MKEWISEIEKKLKEPLPGWTAHKEMWSSNYTVAQRLIYPENHKKAAVLILVYKKDDSLHLPVMRRPESPYHHSRQISLPGGGFEETDQTLEQTALRETEEEFGINQQQMKIIGSLTEVYIPVSNYLVHPFIAISEQKIQFYPDKREVEEIIEIPLTTLPKSKVEKDIAIGSNKYLHKTPCFDHQGEIIWGATAMILNEFTLLL